MVLPAASMVAACPPCGYCPLTNTVSKGFRVNLCPRGRTLHRAGSTGQTAPKAVDGPCSRCELVWRNPKTKLSPQRHEIVPLELVSERTPRGELQMHDAAVAGAFLGMGASVEQKRPHEQ